MGEYRRAKHYPIALVCYNGELIQRIRETQVQAHAA